MIGRGGGDVRVVPVMTAILRADVERPRQQELVRRPRAAAVVRRRIRTGGRGACRQREATIVAVSLALQLERPTGALAGAVPETLGSERETEWHGTS
mmetsp:Transcript_7303/g.15279  ORF Transcript_7303/g.15279 Transcript_7303/m.15279 type:complete len:97 (+) Transcript_7303:2425-2715(+)